MQNEIYANEFHKMAEFFYIRRQISYDAAEMNICKKYESQ